MLTFLFLFMHPALMKHSLQSLHGPLVTSQEPGTATLWSVKGPGSRPADHVFEISYCADTGGLEQSHSTATIPEIFLACNKLVDEAKRFTDCVDNWVMSTPAARRETDIANLAAAGARLGGLLFPGDSAANFLRMLNEFDVQMVRIREEDGELRFPWNLLRLPGDDRWLGEIACFAFLRKGQGGLRDTALVRDAQGIVAGYAEDDRLLSSTPPNPTTPAATGGEMRALASVASLGVEPLSDLPSRPAGKAEWDVIDEWLSRGLHLFHFNCHLIDPEDPEGFTEIGLRMGARASGRDLARQAMPITGGVVLDVCSSAYGTSYWGGNSWSSCFHRRGVPGVCATVSTVTDTFGTSFVEALYAALPRSKYNLFSAMRAAQARLLSETGHPMALYYVYEGSLRYEVGRY